MGNRGKQPRFDEDAFLISADLWSEDLARDIAHDNGIVRLESDHLKVIGYLREHYLAHGTIPAERHMCRELGLEHECIERLFANNLMIAWRISGLPNPGEEAKVYMAQKAH